MFRPGLWSGPLAPADEDGAPGAARRLAGRLHPLLPAVLRIPVARRAVLAPFVAHPERVPYAAARRMVSAYARAGAYEATRRAMRADHFRRHGEVAVPVTLAFGERDRLIRPARAAIQGARAVTLSDCGHVPMWDDPERVARTILATSAPRIGAASA